MTRHTVLVMAAGTGGHIFPALTVARLLKARGMRVEWLGTPAGMENNVLRETGIPLHRLPASGLRGKGGLALLKAPFMLLASLWQALRLMWRLRPGCVLGMGGYVTGPGGLAAWLTRRPLIIHEQNAVAGTSNRLLAPLAKHVLEAFPGTFKSSPKVSSPGNPVRAGILAVGEELQKPFDGDRAMHLLVLGGSQGAQAINELLPPLAARLDSSHRVEIWHQTGRGKVEQTLSAYRELNIGVTDTEGAGDTAAINGHRVTMFIDDMASAYLWADLVLCRSGAGTLAELTVAGLPALLVPLPSAIDDHQTQNAQWMVKGGAAILARQNELNPQKIAEMIAGLCAEPSRLQNMAEASRNLSRPQAGIQVAELCMEACHA